MPSPRIAIIGAGPAGLTMASILQRNGMESKVFELDVDRLSRDQGGIVDLHAKMGQAALREAGLFEKFREHTIPSAEALKLVKSNGEVCWDENDKSGNAPPDTMRDQPEIERTKLRGILLDSVSSSSIVWNKRLLRVEQVQGTNKYNLHFSDSVEEGFDLVVGADGAWSKVRPLVTDAKPYYSGVTVIEMRATEVSTKKKWLSEYIGQGSFFMFDEGRAMIGQQNGKESIRVYVAVRQPETWIADCGIDWNDKELARKTLTERYFADCHEDIKRVISVEAFETLIPRPLYMLEVGLKWDSRPGVTLLGDAAHLMTPFAGVGVNVAMTDAMSLAKALLARRDDFMTELPVNLAAAVKEYEADMFVRGKENMEKTSYGLRNHFSVDGVDERVKQLLARAKKLEELKEQRRK